jgi:hypothetical protein
LAGLEAHCFWAFRFQTVMQTDKVKTNRRQQNRKRAVLPVRVRGTDASGAAFEGLAHTLDLTPTGARLGSIRHVLNALDTLTILYRQRRMEFTVVWTKLIDGKNEYQVGLRSCTEQKEPWGINLFVDAIAETPQKAARMSGAA